MTTIIKRGKKHAVVYYYAGENGTQRHKWRLSMCSSNMGLIRNYINPIIGDIYVQDVDAMVVDKLISKLQKTKAVSFR